MQQVHGRERAAMTAGAAGESIASHAGGAIAGNTTARDSRSTSDAARAVSTSAPAAAKDRCSPDPAMHTDRYRLVTPFALRL